MSLVANTVRCLATSLAHLYSSVKWIHFHAGIVSQFEPWRHGSKWEKWDLVRSPLLRFEVSEKWAPARSPLLRFEVSEKWAPVRNEIIRNLDRTAVKPFDRARARARTSFAREIARANNQCIISRSLAVPL